jgi:hypothetical protein
MFTAVLSEKESLRIVPYPISMDTELPASACALIPTLLPSDFTFMPLPVSTSDVTDFPSADAFTPVAP